MTTRGVGVSEDVEQWSLTTLREKLVKSGAKFASHGRHQGRSKKAAVDQSMKEVRQNA